MSLSDAYAVGGTLKLIKGTVYLQRTANSLWEEVQNDVLVDQGDRIKTGVDSRALIVLPDEHRVAVSEETQLTISHLAPGETKLYLKVGRIKNKVKKLNIELGQYYKVQTPSAVCAVRGTEYSVETTGKKTVLHVDHGIVAFAALKPMESDQRIALANAGGSVRVQLTPNGQASKIEFKGNVQFQTTEESENDDSGKSQPSGLQPPPAPLVTPKPEPENPNWGEKPNDPAYKSTDKGNDGWTPPPPPLGTNTSNGSNSSAAPNPTSGQSSSTGQNSSTGQSSSTGQNSSSGQTSNAINNGQTSSNGNPVNGNSMTDNLGSNSGQGSSANYIPPTGNGNSDSNGNSVDPNVYLGLNALHDIYYNEGLYARCNANLTGDLYTEGKVGRNNLGQLVQYATFISKSGANQITYGNISQLSTDPNSLSADIVKTTFLNPLSANWSLDTRSALGMNGNYSGQNYATGVAHDRLSITDQITTTAMNGHPSQQSGYWQTIFDNESMNLNGKTMWVSDRLAGTFTQLPGTPYQTNARPLVTYSALGGPSMKVHNVFADGTTLDRQITLTNPDGTLSSSSLADNLSFISYFDTQLGVNDILTSNAFQRPMVNYTSLHSIRLAGLYSAVTGSEDSVVRQGGGVWIPDGLVSTRDPSSLP